MAEREDYGIDAPGVVRTLFLAGAALIVVGIVAAALIAAGQRGALLLFLRDNGLVTGAFPLAMSGWMFASSKWLKQRVARRLLDARVWRGDEQVLDIGCGRGLVAIGAAKRLGAGGRVTGIDLWQAQDLGRNSAAAVLANARAAGVADRLTIDTGDARALPYADASFDVVTSMTVIHNIPGRAGRQRAVAEAWRVTRPGGQILIYDIRNARGYAAQLRQLGAIDVRLHGPILLWGPIGWRFSATKPG